MIEPRFSTRFLSQLLQLSRSDVSGRIERGEFGRYFNGRRGVEVTLRGLQAWLRDNSADEKLATVQPFFAPWFLAASYGATQQQLKDEIEEGAFGPFLRINSSKELRVPLSGIVAYDQNNGVGCARAS